MMTKEILANARSLIAKGWTQGPTAKNAAGIAVDPTSGEAVCWCLEGALIASGVNCEDPEATCPMCHQYLIPLGRLVGATGATSYNEALGRTKEEVLALFDRAIAACEEG